MSIFNFILKGKCIFISHEKGIKNTSPKGRNTGNKILTVVITLSNSIPHNKRKLIVGARLLCRTQLYKAGKKRLVNSKPSTICKSIPSGHNFLANAQ